MVKIGFTRKDPSGDRLTELNKDATGLPAKFVLEYSCLVQGGEQLEKAVHSKLMASRYRNDREFFEVTPQQAVSAIKEVAGKNIIFEEGDSAAQRVRSHAVIGNQSSGLKSRPGNCSFTLVVLRSSA